MGSIRKKDNWNNASKRLFGSYSHSGIPRFPFRLFCPSEQNSQNIFRNIPNERALSSLFRKFDYRGLGTGKDYRGDAIGTRETSRDVPTGKTGLPSEQFYFFWEFSSWANRKKRFSFSPEPDVLTKWKASPVKIVLFSRWKLTSGNFFSIYRFLSLSPVPYLLRSFERPGLPRVATKKQFT